VGEAIGLALAAPPVRVRFLLSQRPYETRTREIYMALASFPRAAKALGGDAKVKRTKDQRSRFTRIGLLQVMVLLLLCRPQLGAWQDAKAHVNPAVATAAINAKADWAPLAKFAGAGQVAPYREGAATWTVPFPDPTTLENSTLLAFEQRAGFTYTVLEVRAGNAGRERPAARSPSLVRRVIHLKPSTYLIDDQIQSAAGIEQFRWQVSAKGEVKITGRKIEITDKDGRLVCETLLPHETAHETKGDRVQEIIRQAGPGTVRAIHLVQIQGAQPEKPATAEVKNKEGNINVTINFGKVCKLFLPKGSFGGEIEMPSEKTAKKPRPLASNIIPAADWVERMDRLYQNGKFPAWDTGRPSPELKKLVEAHKLKPGRVVDLGCGSGMHDVYLAEQGFDVTAMDMSPTALALGKERAKEHKVHVNWMLADILWPPADLKPFDIIFDRGCYHGLETRAEKGDYVQAVVQISRPGTRFVLLARDRITEEKIRTEFGPFFKIDSIHSFVFDTRFAKTSPRAGNVFLMTRKKAP
jgi:SAM-dependent methyltransferase